MYNSAFCIFKIMLFSGLVYVYQVSWQTQKALGRFKILCNISQGNRSRRGIHIWHLQRTCMGVLSTCSFIAGDLGHGRWPGTGASGGTFLSKPGKLSCFREWNCVELACSWLSCAPDGPVMLPSVAKSFMYGLPLPVSKYSAQQVSVHWLTPICKWVFIGCYTWARHPLGMRTKTAQILQRRELTK